MTDGLRLGHALITMVEPEPATVSDYNEWYERDHFLAGMLASPGVFAGRRFVATRTLKSVRFPVASPLASPATDGSFLAVYWIEADQLATHCAWGFPEAARLAGLGRMRSDRRHVSTSYYDIVGAQGRGERPVPVELALHHPYEGLVVVWSEGTRGHADHVAWADSMRSALTHEGSPVGRAVSLRPTALPEGFPAMPGVIIGADPARDVLVHCCFVDRNLRHAWRELSLLLHTQFESTDTAHALLVAPFLPSVTGTDTYLDQIW